MTFNSMAQARINSLTRQAVEAIQQYNKEMLAGGEPKFPSWAEELLDILNANLHMALALKEARPFIELVKETAPAARLAIEHIDVALTVAGAV